MVDPAWVALSLVRHLGGRTFKGLLAHFNGNLDAILAASAPELQRVPGVGPKIAQAITSIDVDAVSRAVRRWQDVGVTILTHADPGYPPLLRAVDDAPPTLFALGTVPAAERPAYAVIGSRTPSPAARDTALRLGAALAERDWVVVSGLAAGIDAAAHLGALALPEGITVATLGSGVLRPYPPENRGLARAVIARGALLSEVAPDAPVSAPGLVARNRIISGLCDGVIVVETGADGGAMHAARFARAQGRPVYVVECDASGNRALLADGAQPITTDLSALEYGIGPGEFS